MFGGKDKKDATERAGEKRNYLIGVARNQLRGNFGMTRESRQDALIAGIYLELCAIRDHLSPAADTDDAEDAA